MTGVMELIERYAPADIPVLILGPSGAGKEPVAKSIHLLSRRSEGPFVPLNCAAIPETLVESELFGTVKGAFSGAVDRRGLFEAASKGTLFLDEVGEIPLKTQVKLLRVLQERSFRRVGDTTDRRLDCRVVAATNKNLKAACGDGTFREDLYYRLNVAVIDVPPLGERREDVPLLVDHFLRKHALELYGPTCPVPGISDEAIRAIMRYPFRGNVRELENMLMSALVLSGGKEIYLRHLSKTNAEEENGDCALPDRCGALSSRLLEAIAAEPSQGSGPPSGGWSFKTVSAEDVARYLTETGGREFSRKEFELFLRRSGRHDMNKSLYATAGRCLRALIEKGVLDHNGGKANRSRFRVSKDYLTED